MFTKRTKITNHFSLSSSIGAGSMDIMNKTYNKKLISHILNKQKLNTKNETELQDIEIREKME